MKLYDTLKSYSSISISYYLAFTHIRDIELDNKWHAILKNIVCHNKKKREDDSNSKVYACLTSTIGTYYLCTYDKPSFSYLSDAVVCPP